MRRQSRPAPPDEPVDSGEGAGATDRIQELLAGDHSQQLGQRIVVPADDALFERNDRVVGDRDAFRTNFGTALGDVAETYAELLSQIFNAIAYVQRMHFERGRIHQKSRPDELLLSLIHI